MSSLFDLDCEENEGMDKILDSIDGKCRGWQMSSLSDLDWEGKRTIWIKY